MVTYWQQINVFCDILKAKKFLTSTYIKTGEWILRNSFSD